VTLASEAQPQQIRSLTADRVSKLVHVPGIVIAATRVRAKATKITLRCKGCQSTREIQVRPGFGGVNVPRRCDKYEPLPNHIHVLILHQGNCMSIRSIRCSTRQNTIC